MGKSVGRLSLFISLLFSFQALASSSLNNVRQNLQALRIDAHRLDLETRRLESSKMDLQSELKQIEDELQKLNMEFFEVQRASIGRTSLQKGMSLFSANSFNQFLKQKRWTKNWMVLQNQINDKFAVLKKNKSDKIQALEKVFQAQKEKQNQLQKLENKILAEEKHRRVYLKEIERDSSMRNHQFDKNSMALFLKPMNAPLVQKYGISYLKPWDVTLQNWGWTFNAEAEEKEVLAAADGVVQAIEELPYFGQVLVISHQGDFSTIYAGVHDIVIHPGEQVISGKVLAKAQRIYFELRHFTVPIDPSPWIRDPEESPTENPQATRSAAI